MRFQFRPGLALATSIALAILIALGTWQLQRRAWKDALIRQVETRAASAPIAFEDALARAASGEAMEYQPVYLDGAYDAAQAVRVFGVRDGVAGAYLFTPLRRASGTPVWINRGFVPDARAGETEAIAGETRIFGTLRAPQRLTAIEKMVAAKDQPQDNLYFARDPLRFPDVGAAAAFYVESDGREATTAWPAPAISHADFPNRHLEYALTWYGLAAALAGVFAVYSLKR